MDRLTIVTPIKNGGKAFACNAQNDECGKSAGDCNRCEHYARMRWRLADYEAADLTPAEVAELAAAKREGRLVVAPCKVGDSVWIVFNSDGWELESGKVLDVEWTAVGGFSVSYRTDDGGGGYRISCKGNVFATRAEAEAALAERKEPDGWNQK